MSESGGNVVRLEPAQAAMRQAFLGWQCRLRQIAIRQHDGRPTSGLCPELDVAGQPIGPITVVLNKADPEPSLAQFRFMAKRTHDPRERYKAAIDYLAATYFQTPSSFADDLTALFGPGAKLPRRLAGRDDCVLHFEQFSQRFRLPCAAHLLHADAPAYQATYWHNALFNPEIPSGVQIVAFAPDWAHAEADPPAP